MPTVTVGTSTVNYLRTGRGPGLVLVHGTGADGRSNWAPLIDMVADRYTVVAPDLSGAGATVDDGGPLHVDDLAAQVLGAAEHAGLDGFHLVGHSLGAVVALAAAAARPERVRSVIAHAGWARTDPWMAFQFDLWVRLLGHDRELLARLLQLTAMSDDTLRARGHQDFASATAGFSSLLEGAGQGFVRQARADIDVDITASLSRITAPTLIISSRDDRIVPPHHQRELAELIEKAEFLELPGGHGLPFEHPGSFAEAVASRLAAFAG
ncbi:alpha/beta fold hydrolase [Planomonospora sp. ID67723]|uniref:alpha/beta fold hydrolase n=1 Tax=Planomonospora sp. ID67723 TaxID=2738134 RepID=UPI0018C3BCD9|nr:alpha/beta fold hydrolase [Planomonospora sp. ID67723]MBG0829222.1 alpha/beta fold hydrolase [Planomonospora sp. ID67723]